MRIIGNLGEKRERERWKIAKRVYKKILRKKFHCLQCDTLFVLDKGDIQANKEESDPCLKYRFFCPSCKKPFLLFHEVRKIIPPSYFYATPLEKIYALDQNKEE